ncbi:hypothetical protein GCM10028857_19110 [Salinarchaeum chitinilyticum]
MSGAEAKKVERFTERVAEETDYDIWVDPTLGDDLGWFMVDTEIELQGEPFDAEVDFNLSESDVSLLYAEITIDPSDEGRRKILEEEADPLEPTLYDYYPDESEVEEVVEELRRVHSEIYG